MPDNPCRDGHPELALLLECTALGERYPTMHCRRCGENLTYEEAIRNDERLRVAARIAELEAIVGSVQHYGYAYEVRDPRIGAKQLLDPRDVTVILPAERAGEFLASWERRALRAEARVAELERQRDAVVAVCDEADASGNSSDWDAPSGKVIRKVYGGGE